MYNVQCKYKCKKCADSPLYEHDYLLRQREKERIPGAF